MKYLAYIRKSSEDKKRQIQSIPRQYEWCKKEAERRGFKISLFFEDSNSAHKLYRKGFKDMIDTIEESEEPIGIITWKISRLSRNPIDEGVIKYAFIRGKIKHIVARDREYKEHESQIIMGVDFGQATQFSIELSKDVKEGMNKKVSSGHQPSKAPYGYINDPIGLKGEKKVFVDEKYFNPIQGFLRAYLTGIYSIPELQRKLTEQGVLTRSGKPFSVSTLYLILKRRFYCGEFLWNGEIKQGKHKPMISVEEHERIQILLTRLHKPSQNKYQNYYSGFIICQYCQSTITGYSKTKNNRIKGQTTYHYLKCGKKKAKYCPQIQLTRANVDKQILAILKNLIIPEKIVDFIIKNIEIAISKEQSKSSQCIGQLQRKFNELDSEIETLGRKLIKGVISDEFFTKMNNTLESEQKLISNKIKRHHAGNFKELEKLKKIFLFLDSAPKKFQSGSFELKKLILKTIGSNFTLNNEKVGVELSKGFSTVQKAKNQFMLKNRWVEPELNCSMKGLRSVKSDDTFVWSAWWDELRTYLTENEVIIPKI